MMGILEALCACGETFNPADETDLEHVERADGTPCGKRGEIIGEWGAPAPMVRVTVRPLVASSVSEIIDRLEVIRDEIQAGAFESGADWSMVDEVTARAVES